MTDSYRGLKPEMLRKLLLNPALELLLTCCLTKAYETTQDPSQQALNNSIFERPLLDIMIGHARHIGDAR